MGVLFLIVPASALLVLVFTCYFAKSIIRTHRRDDRADISQSLFHIINWFFKWSAVLLAIALFSGLVFSYHYVTNLETPLDFILILVLSTLLSWLLAASLFRQSGQAVSTIYQNVRKPNGNETELSILLSYPIALTLLSGMLLLFGGTYLFLDENIDWLGFTATSHPHSAFTNSVTGLIAATGGLLLIGLLLIPFSRIIGHVVTLSKSSSKQTASQLSLDHPLNPSSLIEPFSTLVSGAGSRSITTALLLAGSLLATSILGMYYHHPFEADPSALFRGFTGIVYPFVFAAIALLASLFGLSFLRSQLTHRPPAQVLLLGQTLIFTTTLLLGYLALRGLLPNEWSYNEPFYAEPATVSSHALYLCILAGLAVGSFLPFTFQFKSNGKYPKWIASLRQCSVPVLTTILLYFSFTLAGLYGAAITVFSMATMLVIPQTILTFGALSKCQYQLTERSDDMPESWHRSETLEKSGSRLFQGSRGVTDAAAIGSSIVLFGAAMAASQSTGYELAEWTFLIGLAGGIALSLILWPVHHLSGRVVQKKLIRLITHDIESNEALRSARQVFRKNDGVDQKEWSQPDQKVVEDVYKMINWVRPIGNTAFYTLLLTIGSLLFFGSLLVWLITTQELSTIAGLLIGVIAGGQLPLRNREQDCGTPRASIHLIPMSISYSLLLVLLLH